MRRWIARRTKKSAKMLGSLGIFLCVVFSASGLADKAATNCNLTVTFQGLEIPDGGYVRATSGRLNQVYCNAYCTGSGASHAFQFFRNDYRRPISTLASQRIYSVKTTFGRDIILNVQDMVESDAGVYYCKGWINGQGWQQRYFNLVFACPNNHMLCDNTRCIMDKDVCNGVDDCDDKKDESECDPKDCGEDMFECDDGQCHSKTMLCDFYPDCLDGYDEAADTCVQHQCPILYPPTNGRVYVSGYQKGDKARYSCDIGYALEGQEEIVCLEYQAWSGLAPMCRTRLSVGKRGLDVIVILDTSASIGHVSLELAKNFTKIIVKIFGVSASADGGGNGTRFAFITFDHTASLVFNLNDPTLRSVDAVIQKINQIKNTGGGTSLIAAIDMAVRDVYLELIRKDVHRGGADTNRAVFILTDAEETVQRDTNRLKRRIRHLKEVGFKVFALAVGRNFDRQILRAIASEPHHEHVFFLDDFKDLQKISDTIAGRNIDFGECGKPGKANVQQDTGEAVKGAWPWIGWIGARVKLCGGALLCDQFFITAARCVSEVNERTTELVSYPAHEISVSLGIIKLFDQDNEEQRTYPVKVIRHPTYTGIPDKYGIRNNDVAILDLGEINKTRASLNSFIKPICFPYRKLLNFSASLLKDLKGLEHNNAKGFTAGWGLMPEKHRQTPWNALNQNRRSIQSDRECELMYPGLDTDRVFCVGNIQTETETCRGDVGGVYMAELPYMGRYTALGISLRSYDCSKERHFSVFLNLHHPDITGWMESVLGRCNRLGSVEEEEKEAERERKELERQVAEKAAKDKEASETKKLKKQKAT
ncbi:complement C2-like isoform X2 [Dreissena polymorpha]|uniref:complement C2-like isoform X2 n=1 Tax=Dreissena polymorpha TaxID=45954 RepID=UPI0022652137|nr:complement C2-like isoform X2 [Dreissena polymorpha]